VIAFFNYIEKRHKVTVKRIEKYMDLFLNFNVVMLIDLIRRVNIGFKDSISIEIYSTQILYIMWPSRININKMKFYLI
jgi:hypothetical protein